MGRRLYFNDGGIHDSNSEQLIIGVYMTLFFTFSRVKEIWIPPFEKIERAVAKKFATALFFGAPCERTFQRVKVPNPPDSGKDIAEHQGCPSRGGI